MEKSVKEFTTKVDKRSCRRSEAAELPSYRPKGSACDDLRIGLIILQIAPLRPLLVVNKVSRKPHK